MRQGRSPPQTSQTQVREGRHMAGVEAPRVEVHLWYELKRERGNTCHHMYCTWHECGQAAAAGMEFVS